GEKRRGAVGKIGEAGGRGAKAQRSSEGCEAQISRLGQKPCDRDRCRHTDDSRDQAPACLRQRLPPRRLSKKQDGQRCRERRLELEPEARDQRYYHCDPEAERKAPGTDGKSRETQRELSCRRDGRHRAPCWRSFRSSRG